MKKRVMAIFLSVSLICGVFTAVSAAEQTESSRIKNVIYMIPDGGGMAPFYLADAVKQAGGYDNKDIYPYATQTGQGELHLKEYLRGAITTYSANDSVTDSAAAGTALATGAKTDNGYIGILPSYKPIASILEACQLIGKSTGMVTTYDWSNATPATFSAHDISRSNNIVISEQIVNQGIDVVLGTDFSLAYAGMEEAVKRGYKMINSRADINEVKKGDKIWGNLEKKGFPYDIDNIESTVTLAEMTKAALTALSDSSENGFFLMVEGSQVDGGGHNNNAKAMVGEYLAFDEAFGVAVDYAKGRNDTIVIACPDHDTGGMNLPDDLTAAVAELRNGNQPADVTWTKTGHTDRNGGLFIYLPEGVEYPEGIDITSQNPFEDNIIDNNEIAPYIAKLVGADLQGATDALFVDVTDMGKYDATTKQFIFNDYPVSVIRNTSYAFADGKRIGMNGQVAVMVEGRFYVPQMLLDAMEKGSYDDYALDLDFGADLTPLLPRLNFAMTSPEDISASLTVKNYYINKSLNGYVEFKAPEPFAALGKIELGEINGGAEKVIDLNCKDIDKNGGDFTYEITVENEGKYSFTEHFDGVFYAAYTDKGVTVDGVIDEDEWANAPKVVLDDVSMLYEEENWKGYRDLSAVFSAMYDEDYFYFCATVTDEDFCQNMWAAEVWKGDSIQFGLYNDTDGVYAKKAAGSKYDGLNFGFIDGKPVAYRSQRTTKVYPQETLEQSDDFEFQCRQESIDTIYEIKVRWSYLFGYDLFPQSGDMFAFAFVGNDNDGEGRRGAILYGDGIVGTKDVNKFVPMYLFDTTGNSKPFANRDITIYNKGQKIDFTSQPFMLSNRTMVAALDFLNAVGIEYGLNNDGNIEIQIDDTADPIELVSGKNIENSDVMSTKRDATMFMPLRAVCERAGKTVEWNGETRSVYVN